jgi:hypothetical protein
MARKWWSIVSKNRSLCNLRAICLPAKFYVFSCRIDAVSAIWSSGNLPPKRDKRKLHSDKGQRYLSNYLCSHDVDCGMCQRVEWASCVFTSLERAQLRLFCYVTKEKVPLRHMVLLSKFCERPTFRTMQYREETTVVYRYYTSYCDSK